MKRELLILLAAVTLSVAMVPRLRRAVNLDDDEVFKKSKSSQTAVNFCLPQTPCAWSVYKSHTKIIETDIINSYCTCRPDMMCLAIGEDLNHGGMVHYCKQPVSEDNSES